ncbi:MAG: WHG domain-containing protein [Opitutaceae bacterium]|nr:WHG domain-containing protein [Opitutaceae bacterium]
MASRLLAAAIDLIESTGGCRGVNLRQIASTAGCAHTNAYNYFDSLEALFWAVLEETLERQFTLTAQRLQRPAAKRAPLRAFLQTQIAFARAHPALYRLFWMEPLSGEPPPSVVNRFEEMRTAWVRTIGNHTGDRLDEASLTHIGQIAHGYFHGEISKLISRHAFLPKPTGDRDRILNNTIALVELISAGQQGLAAHRGRPRASRRTRPGAARAGKSARA